MNFSVINNSAANVTLNNLSSTQNQMQDAVAQLSSGMRINKAADDAAGLAISQQMQAQVNGLNQANQNAQDGVSLIQTAEGGMGQIQNILQRMRTLSVQAANGTMDTSDQTNIKTEMDQLASQIDDISNKTAFNGISLLASGAGGQTLSLQTGSNTNDQMSITIAGTDTTTLGVNALDVTAAGGATAAISAIDVAISSISTDRANLGAYQNRLNYTMSNLQTESQNLGTAESNITNVNMAQEMSQFTQLNVLQQAGASVLSQANQMPQVILKLLQ